MKCVNKYSKSLGDELNSISDDKNEEKENLNKMEKIILIAALMVLLIITPSLNACRISSKGPKPIDGLVTGYVYTEVLLKSESKPRKVFLTDVFVAVKDESGKIVASDTTDLDGGYRTKDIKKGKYKIYLSKLGYDIVNYDLKIQFATNHPGLLKVNLKGNDFVYGTVKLADGHPAFFRNEVFGVNFYTSVSSEGSKPENVVRCNTAGEFILVGVQRENGFNITAVCQNASITQSVRVDGLAHELFFKNTKPLIQSIVAFNDAGRPILRTLPSAKLKIVANIDDKEGQTLTYMWLPYGDYPGSSFANSNEVVWQLTPVKAENVLVLLVLDNNGGAAFTSYAIEGNDGKVAFTGVVENIDGSGTIPDAVVKINGRQVAKTGSEGYFSVRFEETENNRYVLNIEKPGYMLSSSIFLKEAYEQAYKLVKATTKDFDPSDNINLTEEEDEYTKFSIEDRKGKRSRPGAFIKIPAGNIVDSSGNKVTSMVIVQLRTIDLYNQQGLMPGDYGAIQNGVDNTLISYGAIDVQIRNKANPEIRYRLNKSGIADLAVPISSDLQDSSPSNITLWDYNETTGIWESIGNLKKEGNKYVGTTNRFSSVNTDVAITGGTCIFLTDNPNNPIFPGSNCDVTITIPTSGAPKIKHAIISNADPTLIIARLPLNTDITIEVKRGTNVVASRIIHTSSSSSVSASDINPANPSAVCTVDFYKKDPPVADVAGSFAPFLSMVTTLSNAQALAYYKSTGAIADDNNDGIFDLSEGETFADWKTRNGFGASSSDDEHASYFNAGDLGFHRAMHQEGTGSHVAYYVSNFNSSVNAETNVFGPGTVVPAASVAMEYDKNSNTGTRGIIKFFLFKGPSETLDTHVDLDGNGEKFIPGLCIECHGGRETDYTTLSAGTGLQSYYLTNPTHTPCFLAFDLQSFNYSGAHPRNSQEVNLRNLNQKVFDANSTQAIKDFLNAAYGVTGILSGNFNDNSVAVNWNAGSTNGINNAFFYPTVVGPSCRTCHASKEQNIPLQFNQPADFAGYPVCGTGKYMPNAQVTFINFWTSNNPYQPEQLRLFLGDPNPCE